MLHRFVLQVFPSQGEVATASNSVLTGTFLHWACSTHAFSTTEEGLWQALVWCIRPSRTRITPVSSKAQSALGWGIKAAPVLCIGHFLVTLISQSKSQGRMREINVLYDTEILLLLEKCVTKGLKLNLRGAWLTSKMCTAPLHNSSRSKIIYQHYLSSVCGLEGEELPPRITYPGSKWVFRHEVFSQQKEHYTHLTSPRLHHNLGHVDDVSHHFYVLSFPALDGFRKDLQLKLFPLPQLLALWLGITAELC